jgi:hypothetical protein
MTECDPAFGEIVGGEFEGNLVARQNSNAIAAQTAGEMGQHDTFVLELHAEKTAREFFENGSGYFYAVFLAHATLLIGLRSFTLIPPLEIETGRAAGTAGRLILNWASQARITLRAYHGDVRCLEAFRPTRDLELHLRALIQRTISIRLNRGKVNEYILAAFALDESEAFGRIKPLHSTLFSHQKTS